MRLRLLLPFAGALALAGCGVSGSPLTTTSQEPSQRASLTVSHHAVYSQDAVRYAGRTITIRRSQ